MWNALNGPVAVVLGCEARLCNTKLHVERLLDRFSKDGHTSSNFWPNSSPQPKTIALSNW